jgi:hypothetical protein
VALDPTGKAPGRGAYLCRAEACLVAALRKGGLAGALRAPLTPADRAALEAAWTALPATANAATEPR